MRLPARVLSELVARMRAGLFLATPLSGPAFESRQADLCESVSERLSAFVIKLFDELTLALAGISGAVIPLLRDRPALAEPVKSGRTDSGRLEIRPQGWFLDGQRTTGSCRT
jgi:hypothetical protein